MHLRHAAQAICILHPRIVVPVRLANLALLEQTPQMRRRRHLSRMRPHRVNPLVEGRRRTFERLQRHRSGQIGQLRHTQGARQRQPTDGRDSLRSVQQRQALFCLEHQRLDLCAL